MPHLKPQLIDMIRTVPEVAVRIWAGARGTSIGDNIRIIFPDTPQEQKMDVCPEAFFAAEKVVKALSVRWMNRQLRSMGDLLELRHAAEDIFLEDLFVGGNVPKVLFVPAGVTASGFYRAMIPADMIYEGGKVISHWTASVDLSKILRYDVLWIQLITSKVLVELARLAKGQGVKIVYDIDDRLDAIPAENQAISIYGEKSKKDELDAMLALADLVTVSTEPLARSMRERGVKNVKVLKNQMTAIVAPPKHPANKDFVRILWAGSPTHKRDLAIVAPAVRKILMKYDGKVRFICMGERVPEALADCFKYIDIYEPVDFEYYHDRIATFGADFAIAPLEDNTFNESKSAIKAIEYAAAGYPMLLSPVGEYPTVVNEGLPAELVANDQWEAAIERMLAMSREDRDALGKQCTKWAIANRCIARTKGSQWSDVILDLVGTDNAKKTESKLKLV
jgi:glycosyltransferase involved in cell wall biosynthesis